MNPDNNQRHDDDTEDDYEAFESPVIEDEAPESVQAMQPASYAYPDLLRVQANQTSQSVINDDDPPESQLSFTQRVRQSIQNQSNNGSHGSSSNASGSGGSSRPGAETGAIPKRPAPPPDVSLPGPSSVNSGLPQPADVITHAKSANPSHINLNHAGDHQRNEQLAELERDVVTLQTQRAILQQQLSQKDNQIRDLREKAADCEPVASSLASVAASVASIQASMEIMAREVSDRLKRLETRLDNFSVVENQSGSRQLILDRSSSALRSELANLREQHRRDAQTAHSRCILISR